MPSPPGVDRSFWCGAGWTCLVCLVSWVDQVLRSNGIVQNDIDDRLCENSGVQESKLLTYRPERFDSVQDKIPRKSHVLYIYQPFTVTVHRIR
jgi:hypothetical protein